MNASQIPQESEDKEHKETPLTIEVRIIVSPSLFFLPKLISVALCDRLLVLQAFKETLAKIRLCSRLEGLLIRKRQLSNGDSPDIHAQKVSL